MTKREARKMLKDAAEDAEWDPQDIADIFKALYGRRPDKHDGDLGHQLSLCYAAL